MVFRYTYDITSSQNVKMEDQIGLLTEKLAFFIDYVKKEQSRQKRGEYFTHKEEEFRGNQPANPCREGRGDRQDSQENEEDQEPHRGHAQAAEDVLRHRPHHRTGK